MRKWLLLGVSALLGIFAGVSATGQWRTFLLWQHRQSFGKVDPYFHKDIGFYFFDLPWLHYLVDFVTDGPGARAAGGGASCTTSSAASGSRAGRPVLRRGAGADLGAARAVRAAQGGRLLARPVRPDHAVRQPVHRA